uniref:Cyclin n=1 Tax=Neobodo designis TaxID=312471 RepID=A0A7S1L675_NEODS|mmetsp:Transcript_15634/g.48425  ORF Transcript_15634/g.48425 Transcript_15634/m.48425 type:complete len:262 (+) Transcript_15634:187-972(+)
MALSRNVSNGSFGVSIEAAPSMVSDAPQPVGAADTTPLLVTPNSATPGLLGVVSPPSSTTATGGKEAEQCPRHAHGNSPPNDFAAEPLQYLPAEQLPSGPHLAASLQAVDHVARQRHNAAYNHADDYGYGPHVTPFHSSVVPDVPLHSFAYLVCSRTQYGRTGLALGLGLLCRAVACGGAPLNALTMHRLLLTCIVVAAKTNFDRFVRNDKVAELVSMEPDELNRLEVTLLSAVDFRAIPSPLEVTDAPFRLPESTAHAHS